MGDRPVGPVDFASRDLVYHIACEASIMGTIPQVEDQRQILTMRPEAIRAIQATTHAHRLTSVLDARSQSKEPTLPLPVSAGFKFR